LGTVLANRQRISLHHPKRKGKRGVDLSDVAGRQKREVARETRANAERERAVELNSIGHCHAEWNETSLVYFLCDD
jgi:hypothetical protein